MSGPALRWEVRAGRYLDSVVLMRVQQGLTALPGVQDAAAVMATPANREILTAAGLWPQSCEARPDDLLIVVAAQDEESAGHALGRVTDLLQARAQGGSDPGFRARTVATALRQLPEARWGLVSVPGRFAGSVAHELLDEGRHVFLYSDHVPLETELELKTRARDAGLMVMGPDCGTAVVGGVGMGFANRLRPGRVGLLGASGTGLQTISSHLHAMGAGVSHVLGTGGRDLSSEIGGITALQALDLLGRDPVTQVIVLVSKPPAPAVAAQVLATAQRVEKPVVAYLLGAPSPGRRLGNVRFAASSTDAARVAVEILGRSRRIEMGDRWRRPERPPGSARYIRGLFSGGTLALETFLSLQSLLHPLTSNVSPRAEDRIQDLHRSSGHTILDLGDDEFTAGRLHPMIDHELRVRRLAQEAEDPEVSVILLDVVLGDGAHPDPASVLAPALARAREAAAARDDELDLVVILVGTDRDPQDLEKQERHLRESGARVCRTVSEALTYAGAKLTSRGLSTIQLPDARPDVPLDSLEAPLVAINVGLETFYDSLIDQGAGAVQVDWRPPAGGNPAMADLLARMKKRR